MKRLVIIFLMVVFITSIHCMDNNDVVFLKMLAIVAVKNDYYAVVDGKLSYDYVLQRTILINSNLMNSKPGTNYIKYWNEYYKIAVKSKGIRPEYDSENNTYRRLKNLYNMLILEVQPLLRNYVD